MSVHQITIEQTAQVPRKVLFNLLADHENLNRFFHGQFSLVKAGTPETNGIGAVRQVSAGPFTYQEQIIDYKENEHLHYKVIQGGPVKEHGSWIQIQSLNAKQSRIHYRIMFSPKVEGTGWLIKFILEQELKKALQHIAKHGEKEWQS
ncbi:hypothetical protein A3K86_20040 [Photobacterium jeanii]|uniref:Coenzyme Q-binding protein COQ10 START domain-containing protein n=1 Tax=Photobacterium jeanii TaxID=858640 RepID=A0A178K1R6_9GAMM|nr:SRPBCC family protein [Photobacterium jeanii]OAN11250.1 hypothetical protein A3K86_20040 [Photobacterium jeanii]PST90770.1 SRPBCC family protein [Photobacterium jeanii]